MKPKISVIVPIYNTEKYLEKCLDTLVNQTLEDIEIILINDGSPDNSEKIVEKYIDKYQDKIVYYKKENEGQGVARNYGIDIARGQFISFVDSDDYIDKTMFEKLYNKAIENKADKESDSGIIEVVEVTDEEVARIKFTNVKGYNQFYLYVEIPASDKSSAVTGVMKFPNNLSLVNGYVSSGITNGNRYYHLIANKNNGIWNVKFGLATTKGQDATVALKHSISGFNLNDTRYQGEFGSVEFASITSGVYLPVGTRIELRGAK